MGGRDTVAADKEQTDPPAEDDEDRQLRVHQYRFGAPDDVCTGQVERREAEDDGAGQDLAQLPVWIGAEQNRAIAAEGDGVQAEHDEVAEPQQQVQRSGDGRAEALVKKKNRRTPTLRIRTDSKAYERPVKAAITPPTTNDR